MWNIVMVLGVQDTALALYLPSSESRTFFAFALVGIMDSTKTEVGFCVSALF